MCITLKISFRANNFIRNDITRSLNIFGINKIDVSYCLLPNTSALIPKGHFQSMAFECMAFQKWLLESKAKILDNKQ